MDTSGGGVTDQTKMQPQGGAPAAPVHSPMGVQAGQSQSGAGEAVARQQPVVQPSVPQGAVTAPQPQSGVSGQPQGKPAGAKEVGTISGVGGVVAAETVPIVEVGDPGELPPEVSGWLERVERDTVPEPPVIVHQGQPILSPSTPQQVTVTLPLTDEEVKKGLHEQLFESLRWLAEWCWRLVKKYQGRIGYKK